MEYSTTISLRNRRILLGIDEAGRGSLVGDMFVVGICVDASKLRLLEELGVRDSKLLTPDVREKLYGRIIGIVDHVIVKRIPPNRIDKENLNELFIEAVTEITKEALVRCGNIDKVYVDLTGSKDRLVNAIRGVGFSGGIVAEHYADKNYIVVSTASIVAKVLRDRHIKELSRTYGDIGSGYPSDPKTIAWLKRIVEGKGELPDIVRRSWSTIKRYFPQSYIRKDKKSRHALKTLYDYIK